MLSVVSTHMVHSTVIYWHSQMWPVITSLKDLKQTFLLPDVLYNPLFYYQCRGAESHMTFTVSTIVVEQYIGTSGFRKPCYSSEQRAHYWLPTVSVSTKTVQADYTQLESVATMVLNPAPVYNVQQLWIYSFRWMSDYSVAVLCSELDDVTGPVQVPVTVFIRIVLLILFFPLSIRVPGCQKLQMTA